MRPQRYKKNLDCEEGKRISRPQIYTDFFNAEAQRHRERQRVFFERNDVLADAMVFCPVGMGFVQGTKHFVRDTRHFVLLCVLFIKITRI
jgi:hypothetical protein